jgi:hypothetical protein
MDLMPSRNTTAFFAQAAISFGVAAVAVGIGITYLPVDRWIRGFLAIGALFLVSSSFTLAKCVRDHQEQSQAQMLHLFDGQRPPREALAGLWQSNGDELVRRRKP